MQYLFRSRHYNHAKAYGLSGENGSSATIDALRIFGYGTDEVDPRFDKCYFAGVMHDLQGNMIRLDDGTILEYRPWEVGVDISDEPYDQTAGARMKKYAIDTNATKDGKLMENDIVLFRYADVLLMKSEAKVRNNENKDAELMQVRNRVKASSRSATLKSYWMKGCWSLLGEDGGVRILSALDNLPVYTAIVLNCQVRKTDILRSFLFR